MAEPISQNCEEESGQEEDDNVVGRIAQHLCDYCRKDISTSIRIKCCDCTDFILCVYCFANGVELNIDEQNVHLKTHSYRVIDRVTAAIFDEDWIADDELMLLEGLERYGMGNWQDVANHIGVKSKSKTKVEQHYNAVYLNSDTKPLPNINRVLNPSIYPKETVNYELFNSEQTCSANDTAVALTDPTSQSVASKRKLTADALAAGYRPKRGEFDTEFENHAEEALGDCDLLQYANSPTKLKLTYKMLEIFNRRISERYERKRFLIDRGLLWSKAHSKHKHNKEFKALLQQAKVFSRFFETEEEFVQFVEDLQKQRSLVRDVSELRLHRQQGIRTFQEEFVYKEQSTLRETSGNGVESNDTTQPSPGKPSGSNSNRQELASSLANELLRHRPIIPEQCIISSDGFDISSMDCIDLLDMKERELCTKFKLLPRHFNLLKHKLCVLSYTTGSITRIAALEMIAPPLEIDAANALYDLLLGRGLINSAPPGTPAHLMHAQPARSESESSGTPRVHPLVLTGRPPLAKKMKIKL